MQKNLPEFASYIQSLNFAFSVIGLSETWLRDDTCGLNDMENHTLIEKYLPRYKMRQRSWFIYEQVATI